MRITCSNLELRVASAVIGLFFLTLIYRGFPAPILSVGILAVMLGALYEWTYFFPLCSWKYWLYGLLYIVVPGSLLLALNHSDTRYLLPLACLLTYSNDAGAYIAGKLWGNKKLCPSISPNKTWVGLWGGYAVCLATLWLYAGNSFLHQIAAYVILGVIVSTLAVVGDLFESWLKRRVNLKDSGSCLPGHGGILDRIDSLLPVAVFFYTAQSWIVALLQ